MEGIERIPKEVVDYAQRFYRYIPGDMPSIACGQWAIETGWGVAPGLGGRLWREGDNPFAIKVAKDQSYQAGEMEGHATYASVSHAFMDRRRILTIYRAWAISRGMIPFDVLGLLDTWWAPNQDYRKKLVRIIMDNGLYLLDPVAKQG